MDLPTHQRITNALTGEVFSVREIVWDADGMALTVIDPPELPAGRYTVALTDPEGNPVSHPLHA